LRAAVLDIDRFRPVEHLTDLPLTTSEDDADWRAMTNTQVPVLMASLVALGACSYEVSIGGGGGGGGGATFDATKIGELVESVARYHVGEPSGVRCPPRMQFLPRDRYTCQVDVDGTTYDVIVRHRPWMSASGRFREHTFGGVPLAEKIEEMLAGRIGDRALDVDCHGVVVSPARPQGVCTVDDLATNEGILVTLASDQLNFKLVEWNGWSM
jgi:hypothetical protein